ncbi:hypothetical protein A5674_18810 [Mycobacterium malmoense]|nr:hypothetical protein A5674_18810 [Mycobacterium malmoense]
MVAREYPALATQRMVAAMIRARVRSPSAPTGRPSGDRVTLMRRGARRGAVHHALRTSALIDRSIIFDRAGSRRPADGT